MGNKMQERLTVSQLTRYIKRVFSFDNVLSNVCVTGEISNFKLHSSGHMYFTLKDEQSVIRCVMFKTQAQRLRFIPEDGLKVIVRGYVSIYEAGGLYQLYPESAGVFHPSMVQEKKKTGRRSFLIVYDIIWWGKVFN
jgi:exodeoxyribonuclease VII large subunit